MNLTQGVRGETSDLLASRTLSQIPKTYFIFFFIARAITSELQNSYINRMLFCL